MNIGLYRVIQPVTDIEEAARFYSAVFGDSGERVSAGRHYFRCGGVVLACYDPVKDRDPLGDGWRHHGKQYIYFSVDDLEGVLQRIRHAGGTLDGGIQSMPWGERMFYAKDPFGNPISFVDQDTLFLGTRSDVTPP